MIVNKSTNQKTLIKIHFFNPDEIIYLDTLLEQGINYLCLVERTFISGEFNYCLFNVENLNKEFAIINKLNITDLNKDFASNLDKILNDI